MREQVEKIQPLAEQWTAEDLLRWAFVTFGGRVEIASGFGAEGVVLIDMASRVQPELRVFALDTGFLFPETYALMQRIESRYGLTVDRLRPVCTPEDQERWYGPALWSRDPDTCCNLRKVESLRRKLSGLRAWTTSLRRDQTAHRATARKVDWDTKFCLVKINPLADWTSDQIWGYIREHDVPYNPLHDLGYPSIGCTHCTRSVRPGEHPRAGRWPDVNKTECGMHGTAPPANLVSKIGLEP